MLTQDACNLTPLIEFLGDYLLYRAVGPDRFDEDVDLARMKTRRRKIIQGLNLSQDRLSHWDEIAAAHLVQELVQGCESLHLHDSQELAERIRSLIQLSVYVNNQIQLLAPLASKLDEVPWREGATEEFCWAHDESRAQASLRRCGYLLHLWCGRSSTLKSNSVWRLVRRELSQVTALRLRPYKKPTGRRDTEKIRSPHWSRVPVTVFVPNNLDPRNGKRLGPESFLRPGKDFTIRLGEASWTPNDPETDPEHGLPREAIGYFFIPHTSETDEYGLDNRGILALLMRLSWALCALVPSENGDRLRFRMLASRAELRWQTGGPSRSHQPGHTSPRVFDRWAISNLLPRLFKDSASRDCALVEAALLQDGEPHSYWFRPTWSIPAEHRIRWGEPPCPWLMSTPLFDGRPSWVERIDLAEVTPRRPEFFPEEKEFATVDFPRRAYRKSARTVPPRPLPCSLHLDDNQPRLVYLLNYSANGCCVFLPCGLGKETASSIRNILLKSTGRGQAVLSISSGLGPPWPAIAGAEEVRVHTRLPVVPRGEDTRFIEEAHLVPLGCSGFRVRFLITPFVTQVIRS